MDTAFVVVSGCERVSATLERREAQSEVGFTIPDRRGAVRRKRHKEPPRSRRDAVLRIKCRAMPSLTARVALSLTVCACAQPLRAQDQRPVPTAVWAPKPAQTAPTRPDRSPGSTLPDLKAKHKGETSWHEVIVDDGRLTGEYVAAAPGAKVPRRLHPDTREWFAVVEGEVRVEIEGQAPFTATRGSRGEHPAPDDLLARDDRRQAEPEIPGQRRACEDVVPARGSGSGRATRTRRIVVGAGDAEQNAWRVRPVQPAAR